MIKAILMIFLGCMGMFTLGGYTIGVIEEVRDVSSVQWVITSFFSVYFLIGGVVHALIVNKN